MCPGLMLEYLWCEHCKEGIANIVQQFGVLKFQPGANFVIWGPLTNYGHGVLFNLIAHI